jgi:hypothetical protein
MKAEQTVWSSTHDDFEVLSAKSSFEHLDVSVREAEKGKGRPEGRGRQWVVEMTLSADAPVGPMADHVTLSTNHPEMPSLRIPVSGFVRPILAVSPPFVDFGRREVTGPILASVRVKNFSDTEIKLTSVTADVPELQVSIDPDGSDHYVVIRLMPGLPSGEFSALVTVETDSRDVPVLEIEVKGTIL